MEKSKTTFTPTAEKKTTSKKTSKKSEPVIEEDPAEDLSDLIEEPTEEIIDPSEVPFDLDDVTEEDVEEEVAPVDKDVLTAIRAAFKEADASTKAEVKTVLADYGNKLAAEMKPSDVAKIQQILEI
jgi:hypothetical protein